jgi:hypothetical protein
MHFHSILILQFLQVKDGDIVSAEYKLPVALRSIFGGFVNENLIVCGGYKSHYKPVAYFGN